MESGNSNYTRQVGVFISPDFLDSALAMYAESLNYMQTVKIIVSVPII